MFASYFIAQIPKGQLSYCDKQSTEFVTKRPMRLVVDSPLNDTVAV